MSGADAFHFESRVFGWIFENGVEWGVDGNLFAISLKNVRRRHAAVCTGEKLVFPLKMRECGLGWQTPFTGPQRYLQNVRYENGEVKNMRR